MAIRYVCETCGDLEPAAWEEEKETWKFPEMWYTLGVPQSEAQQHYCSAECVMEALRERGVKGEVSE